MKQKFINFLKTRHALDEYERNIAPFELDDLNHEFEDGGAEFILDDGCVFFYKNADDDIDWQSLADEWRKMTGEPI